MSSNIRARYEASPRSANAQALRELADVAGSNDAVDVLCLCLDVADNDGIGEEEEKQLKNCSGSAASAGSVPVIGKLRWAAAVLLFLVVAIDFTSKMLSIRQMAYCGRGCCVSLAAYQIQQLTLCKRHFQVPLTEC